MNIIINAIEKQVLNLSIADDVRIRKEYFGGLIFKRSSMEIFEVNDMTFILLKLINGYRSLEDIYFEFSKKYSISKENVYSLIQELIERKIIQC